jgi:hypothetical protein
MTATKEDKARFFILRSREDAGMNFPFASTAAHASQTSRKLLDGL